MTEPQLQHGARRTARPRRPQARTARALKRGPTGFSCLESPLLAASAPPTGGFVATRGHAALPHSQMAARSNMGSPNPAKTAPPLALPGALAAADAFAPPQQADFYSETMADDEKIKLQSGDNEVCCCCRSSLRAEAPRSCVADALRPAGLRGDARRGLHGRDDQRCPLLCCPCVLTALCPWLLLHPPVC